MTTVTLIDNYDSFTWNLVHCPGALGADVTVLRNDKLGVGRDHGGGARRDRASRPAPRPPARRRDLASNSLRPRGPPSQFLGFASGIRRSARPLAARSSARQNPCMASSHRLNTRAKRFFAVSMARSGPAPYHSLVVHGDTMPDDILLGPQELMVLSWAFAQAVFPAHGVQFHPESIASEHGLRIFEEFSFFFFFFDPQ